MKTITGNEPAMPLSLLEYEGEIHSNEDISYECKGLSIRQHFAAMFMNGLLSSMGGHDVTDYDDMAHDAVMATDALIKELNKEI